MRCTFWAAAFLGAVYAVIPPTLDKQDRNVAAHVPIQRSTRKRWKRDGQRSNIGLGDVLDVTYTVLVQVGETLTPLILDTGSADLWVLSEGCGDRCPAANVPLYPQNALHAVGQDIELLYGDSRTGTHANGPIGLDTVRLAGISVPNQYFAAIVDTNTSVLEAGSAGILGLGFPPVSVIWRQLLGRDAPGPYLAERAEAGDSSVEQGRHASRAQYASATDSFPTIGPLLTRLVTLNLLSRPLVVTTLQRDTLSLSGNAGSLSLGELPYGLTDEYLTWVPVRGYTALEGGLPPPPNSPDEIYPLVWEIPLDDVYFDGIKLPRSTRVPPHISLSALIDTGNSLIRGPQDIISHIHTSLGPTFDCSVPHNLSFQIGGVLFPVDPRDFAQPTSVIPGTVYPDEVGRCTPALAETDPPGNGGFLYSWSLGDPFLKSALVAFYYGNLTHPSRDPPRVGFLSTVPSDAGSALEEAVASAVHNGGVFPSTSEPAPYATPIEMHTLEEVAPSMMTQGSQRAFSGAVTVRLSGGPSSATYSLIPAVLVGMLEYLYG